MRRSDITPQQSYPEMEGATRAQQLENIDERARRIRRQEVRRLWRLWGRGLTAALTRFTAHIRRRRQERITRRELSALDDHMLRDIGLSRGEIPYTARLVGTAPRGSLMERPVTALQVQRSPSPQVVMYQPSAQPRSRAA